MPSAVTYWTGVWRPGREALVERSPAAARSARRTRAGRVVFLGQRSMVSIGERVIGSQRNAGRCRAPSPPRSSRAGPSRTCSAPSTNGICCAPSAGGRSLFTVALPGRAIDPAMSRKVTAFAAETEPLAEALVRGGVPASQVSVVYPGVDLSYFAPEPPPSSDRFRILFASSPADAAEFPSAASRSRRARARPSRRRHRAVVAQLGRPTLPPIAAFAALSPPSNVIIESRAGRSMPEAYRSAHAIICCAAKDSASRAPTRSSRARRAAAGDREYDHAASRRSSSGPARAWSCRGPSAPRPKRSTGFATTTASYAARRARALARRHVRRRHVSRALLRAVRGWPERRDMRRSILAVTSELPWPLNTGGHLRTFHILRAPIAASSRAPRRAGRSRSAVVGRGAAGSRPRRRAGHRRRSRSTARSVACGVGRDGASAVCLLSTALLARGSGRSWRARPCSNRPTCSISITSTRSFIALLPRTPAVVDLHNVYSTLADRAAVEQTLLAAARLSQARKPGCCISASVRAMRQTDAGPGDVRRGHPAVRVARRPHGAGARTASTARPMAGSADRTPGRRRQHSLCRRHVLVAERRRVRLSRARGDAASPGRRSARPPPHRRPRRDRKKSERSRDCPGVDVLGEVAAVQPHLLESALLAVPLEAGGGTRLKILEAFAAGLPVVSMAVGCEGLRVTNGEHLVIAERPAFADALIAALSDSNQGERLATNARVRVRELYDSDHRVGAAACDAVARLGMS